MLVLIVLMSKFDDPSALEQWAKDYLTKSGKSFEKKMIQALKVTVRIKRQN